MGNPRNRRRKSRKVFHGNQFVVKQEESCMEGSGSLVADRPSTASSSTSPVSGKRASADASADATTPLSRSSKKIKLTNIQEPMAEELFWFFMHSDVLRNLIDMIGVCKMCESAGLSIMQNNKRKGYARNVIGSGNSTHLPLLKMTSVQDLKSSA